MSDEHVAYEEIAAARRGAGGYREGYDEARRAFLIGQAIRERRLALGLSQTEVAARAGMMQPALSRLEAGGTVPTIPVLERIGVALGTELIVTFGPVRPAGAEASSPVIPVLGHARRAAARCAPRGCHSSVQPAAAGNALVGGFRRLASCGRWGWR